MSSNAKRQDGEEKRMFPSCLRVVKPLSKLSLDDRPGVFKSVASLYLANKLQLM